MNKQSRMSRRSFVMAGGLVGASVLAACSSRNAAEPEPAETEAQEAEAPQPEEGAAQPEPEQVEESPAASKTLVVFYSRADENYGDGGKEWLEVGHTKVMAGYIAEALGADTYEIAPVEAYPEGYDDCCDVAGQELRDDARPAIAGELPDVTPYDVVFIGCPIWWGNEPMIVRTFIEGVNLAGKTIVPFTTHGGSGLGGVPGNLQAALPDSTFLEAHAVAGTAVDGARDEVVAWATGLGIA